MKPSKQSSGGRDLFRERLDTIKAKDAEQAISRIRDHLNHIEAGLDLNAGGPGLADISTILAE